MFGDRRKKNVVETLIEATYLLIALAGVVCLAAGLLLGRYACR